MIFEKLGRRFHILLKERGLSQYKLSTMCPDLSVQTVYNATDGEKNTTLEIIQYICDALEIPVEELFFYLMGLASRIRSSSSLRYTFNSCFLSLLAISVFSCF